MLNLPNQGVSGISASAWRILYSTIAHRTGAGLVVLAFVLSGCSRSDVGTVPTVVDVVASVGTNQITAATFLAESIRRGRSERNEVMETLVRRELLLAEAQRSGFDKSPEMVEAWRNLVINRFAEKQQSRTEELPPPTLEELEASYQANLDRYNVPERVRIALIQLKQSPLAEPERKEALMVRAKGLRDQAVAQAQGSGDFGALARDNSDHRPSRMNGGDLGWIGRNNMSWPAEIMEAMFALKETGEISPLIQGTDGIYLLKLMERHESRPLPFDQVRSRVEYQLTRERAEKAEADFYASLKTTFPVMIDTQRLNTIAPAALSSNIQPPRMPAH